MVNAEMIEMRDTVKFLREFGCNEQVVKETLADEPTTQEIHDEALRWREQHMRDASWVKLLLEGDVQAVRELTLCSIVLTQPIKDSSA